MPRAAARAADHPLPSEFIMKKQDAAQRPAYDKPEKRHYTGLIYDANEIIDAAFRHYRSNGFPFPRLEYHTALQQINDLAAVSDYQATRLTNMANQVPDRYHPHRFAVPIQRTEKGEQPTPLDAYNSDFTLRKALWKCLHMSGGIPRGYVSLLQFVQGVQGASNFRPGYAMSLYRRFCSHVPEARVLDPCFGFGGRLVGAIASRVVGRYVGFDPSRASWRGNIRMLRDLNFRRFAKLWCLPYEDATPRECRPSSMDFAMTSPPYWKKEHYSKDPGQSWLRYPELRQWEQGFLVPLFANTLKFLKPGAFFALCVADVDIGQIVSLVDMSLQAGQMVGFEFFDAEAYPIPLNRSGFTGKKKRAVKTQAGASEKVLFFRKRVPGETPEQLRQVRAFFESERHGTRSLSITPPLLPSTWIKRNRRSR
jgi:hypothetical protein